MDGKEEEEANQQQGKIRKEKSHDTGITREECINCRHCIYSHPMPTSLYFISILQGIRSHYGRENSKKK